MNFSRPINHKTHRSIWLIYSLCAACFIALALHILSLGTSRDGRTCVWLFVIAYPVLTLPALVTFLRICEHSPHRRPAGLKVWLVTLFVGLSPLILLFAGRFILRLPRQPSELPIFLALLATVFVHVAVARYLSGVLAHLQKVNIADPISARKATKSHYLKWPFTVLAAIIMVVALIPYSPIWGIPDPVLLLATHAMVILGIFLLVDALRKRQHFGIQMAALFMATYMAVGSLFTYLVR